MYLGQSSPTTYKTTSILTATAGQTVFTCSYDPLLVDVYQSGVKLLNGIDFTATSGNSITLTVGAALNDTLEVVYYKTTLNGNVSPVQLQNGNFLSAQGSGTADAITATLTPAIIGLADGMSLYIRATTANLTTTPTFSPNGLSAKTIVKRNGQALAIGDITGAGHRLHLLYDLTFDKWILMNP